MPANRVKAGKPTMTQKDLARLLYPLLYLDEAEISNFIVMLFQVILQKAKEGEVISISNFGTFYTFDRDGYMGRNPMLNCPKEVPPTTHLKYKPSRYTKGILNPNLQDKIKRGRDTMSFAYDDKYKEFSKLHLDTPFTALYDS